LRISTRSRQPPLVAASPSLPTVQVTSIVAPSSASVGAVMAVTCRSGDGVRAMVAGPPIPRLLSV